MGRDSIEPFLEFKNKHTIILALTSNSGAKDFQFKIFDGKMLYEQVIESSKKWKNSGQIMYVIGANQSDLITNIRKMVPDNFFLIPGIGAQGGNLREVSLKGMNDSCGIIVNASRSIIYSSNEKDFENSANLVAKNLKDQMEDLLKEKQII
jgi:orotidine-5'-phosphate decarboxylase